MKTWIVIDCHNTCHRMFHSMGKLSYDGAGTGVVFGFLQSIRLLQDKFATKRVAFCWDHGEPLRKKDYPEYKANRNKREDFTEDEKASYRDFKKQIHQLKTQYLTKLGYRNNFFESGYEADDLIAAICENLSETEEAVIISTDKDLYQLLRWNVRMYNPVRKHLVSHMSFEQEYGIPAHRWVEVKAMAGDVSDNIKGIQGVGEKTAIKYLNGQLKRKSKVNRRILTEWPELQSNLDLVRLPYVGCPVPRLVNDKLRRSEWNRLTRKLGMETLIDDFPRGFDNRPEAPYEATFPDPYW